MMAILISAPQDTQQQMSVHEFAHPIAVRSINTPETDYNVLAVCSQNHSHVNHVGLFLLVHIAPFRAGGNIHQGCITGVNGGVGSSDTCFSHTWYSFRRGKKAKLVAWRCTKQNRLQKKMYSYTVNATRRLLCLKLIQNPTSTIFPASDLLAKNYR